MKYILYKSHNCNKVGNSGCLCNFCKIGRDHNHRPKTYHRYMYPDKRSSNCYNHHWRNVLQ